MFGIGKNGKEKKVFTLYIDGMMCAGCAAKIKAALDAAGYPGAGADVAAKTVTVTAPASDAGKLRKAVESAGNFAVVKTVKG